MQFSTLFLAAAAVFSGVNAVQFTNVVFNNVTAGKPFTFTWNNNTGPVEILLKNGDPLNLQTVSTITSGQSGSSYVWNVPATLPHDTYAFEIVSGGENNYSPQVELIGGATTSALTASVTSTGGTASRTASSTASVTGVTNSTTSTGSSTRSATTSASRTGSSSSTSASASSTTAPNSSASGFTSNLAFVILAIGALMTLN